MPQQLSRRVHGRCAVCRCCRPFCCCRAISGRSRRSRLRRRHLHVPPNLQGSVPRMAACRNEHAAHLLRGVNCKHSGTVAAAGGICTGPPPQDPHNLQGVAGGQCWLAVQVAGSDGMAFALVGCAHLQASKLHLHGAGLQPARSAAHLLGVEVPQVHVPVLAAAGYKLLGRIVQAVVHHEAGLRGGVGWGSGDGGQCMCGTCAGRCAAG